MWYRLCRLPPKILTKNKAKTEAERVMAAFKAMKIDLSRLHFSTEHVANLRNHEVQVFVK